ncbi:hypothetical protein DYB34_009780 [Aphanomyces astaci]|uniref:SPX domain-containing protein n=1 Tax=Aphanomyces astaci TaxID=112090 RepID=A0A418BJM6_APHAT|nr:hypothetical protein DYB34_009780 [Aphanomyces astaci]
MCIGATCLVLIQESGQDMWTLGDVFLKKYQSLYDIQAKQVSFACPVQALHCGNESAADAVARPILDNVSLSLLDPHTILILFLSGFSILGCLFIIGTYWLYPTLQTKRVLSLLFWLSWCNLVFNALVWIGSVWQYSATSLGCSVQLVVQQFAGVGILLLSAVISIELLRAVSGWQTQTSDLSSWYHSIVWTACTACACHTPIWGRIAFFYVPVLLILVLSLHALQVAIYRLHSTNLIQTESGRRSSQLLVSYVIVFGITSVVPAFRVGMLTFKEKLAHNLVPEWEEHYVNYSELKHHVKQIQRRASFLAMSSGDYTESNEPERARLIKTSKPTHFEEEFLDECEKVERWYCTQLEEFHKQFALLQDQYAQARTSQAPLVPPTTDLDDAPVESDAFTLERDSIKQSLVELYKLLRLLQNFALLNYTALRKVLKKHKKKCGARFEKAHRSLNDSLHDYAFSHALPVKESILHLEHYFTATFHDNDRVLALAELDDWKDSTLNWQNVYTGLKMGICMVLATWLLWDDVALVAFYICELDPHATQDFAHVFDDASHLSMLYLINFIVYVQVENHDFAWSVCFFTTGEFLEPSTSTSACSSNFYYARVAVPLISALPLWWRCVQSLRRVYEMKGWFPGLLNAIKYALAQLVVLFGLFHSFYSPVEPSNVVQVLWVVLFVVSSVYSWLWDVVMDWGLGRPQNHFLGDGHMYSRRWVYYAAMAVDFVLCFSWTLALIPPTDEYSVVVGVLLYLQPVTMFMEPIRRSMWSCFAMENEHLRNTLGFRKERFIPLHFERKPQKKATDKRDDSQMLTFKDKLAHNIVPEWEEHYVNYSDLKHLVKQIQSRMSFEELDDPLAYCDSSTSERVRLLKTSSTQVHFDQEFLNECEKVDEWYSLQLSACQTEFVRLKDEYADARAAAGPSIEISSSNAMTPTCKDSHSSLPSIVPTEHFNSTCHSIKQSFVALYKSLRMLQNYALLNYTALNKILKKHKRICGHDRFEPERRVLNFSLHEFAFSHALPVKSSIVELEAFVTSAFFAGDRVLALAELDDGKDTNAVNWQHVVMGVKMGVCMVLALWLLWDDVVVVVLCDTGDKTIVKYILELDPHVTPAFSQVFDDASHLSTVYFVSFLLYMQLEHKVHSYNYTRGVILRSNSTEL